MYPKIISKQALPVLILIGLVLTIASFVSQNKQSVHIQNKSVTQENQGFPTRLKIPSINVNAAIQYVGLTPTGEMDVPNNFTDVGWYAPGSIPGEKGSAVIDGHFDGLDGQSGVFANLSKLKMGDTVKVEKSNGTTISFIVKRSQMYVPDYADDVFGRGDGSHLNLITCDGVWDEASKSYSKRLVVFTDLAIDK